MNLLRAINHYLSSHSPQILLVLLFTTIWMCSCSKNNFEDVDPGKDGRLYTGIEKVNSWTYQYDTIVYSGTNRDTFSGYLKYEIQGTPDIAGNDTIYQVIQYWKPNDSTSFILSRVENIRIEQNRFIVSQDGLNFIKLVFPINENTSWLGNSLFDTTEDIIESVGGETIATIDKGFEWRYHVDSINYTTTKGELFFNNTIAINLVEHLTNVSERIVNEEYAENVGLIAKQMTILNRPNKTDFPLIEDANKGYTMRMTLKSFN